MDEQKDQSLKDIKITKPYISEETRREMAQFFWKTSVPRILAARQKESKLKGKENAEQ